jgi:glutamate carboxypeptidase
MGYGQHSQEAEYVELDSVAPRLYLLARMIMETSRE